MTSDRGGCQPDPAFADRAGIPGGIRWSRECLSLIVASGRVCHHAVRSLVSAAAGVQPAPWERPRSPRAGSSGRSNGGCPFRRAGVVLIAIESSGRGDVEPREYRRGDGRAVRHAAGGDLRSLLETAGPGGRIRLFILDGGLTEETRQRLLRSCADPRIVEVSAGSRSTRRRSGSCQSGDTSARPATTVILIPKVLLPDVHRVLYLDGDLLIRRDVLSLLALGPGGPSLPRGACDSARALTSDSFAAADDYRRSAPYNRRPPACPGRPGAGNRGRQPDYFNSGVMVIDVDGLRRESVCERLVECLRVQPGLRAVGGTSTP